MCLKIKIIILKNKNNNTRQSHEEGRQKQREDDVNVNDKSPPLLENSTLFSSRCKRTKTRRWKCCKKRIHAYVLNLVRFKVVIVHRFRRPSRAFRTGARNKFLLLVYKIVLRRWFEWEVFCFFFVVETEHCFKVVKALEFWSIFEWCFGQDVPYKRDESTKHSKYDAWIIIVLHVLFNSLSRTGYSFVSLLAKTKEEFLFFSSRKLSRSDFARMSSY